MNYGYGKVFGRFFVEQDLGITCDDTPDTCTLSELVETFEAWSSFIQQVPFKVKQLFTMFETSDVHPDIIKCMKLFDRVIVPFDHLTFTQVNLFVKIQSSFQNKKIQINLYFCILVRMI